MNDIVEISSDSSSSEFDDNFDQTNFNMTLNIYGDFADQKVLSPHQVSKMMEEIIKEVCDVTSVCIDMLTQYHRLIK
jgi:hypothetical protein